MVDLKAIGMLETLGLIPAIEAADSMAKAANVSLKGKYIVGGGLVTIIVEGDVGAVRAAVDAGSDSASRVGQVLSTHIIPRPHNEVGAILENSSNNMNPIKDDDNLAIKVLEEEKEDNCAQSQLKDEEVEVNETFSTDDLNKLKVVQLRSLLRKIGSESMTPEEIKYANKEVLIKEIKNIKEECKK